MRPPSYKFNLKEASLGNQLAGPWTESFIYTFDRHDQLPSFEEALDKARTLRPWHSAFIGVICDPARSRIYQYLPPGPPMLTPWVAPPSHQKFFQPLSLLQQLASLGEAEPGLRVFTTRYFARVDPNWLGRLPRHGFATPLASEWLYGELNEQFGAVKPGEIWVERGFFLRREP